MKKLYSVKISMVLAALVLIFALLAFSLLNGSVAWLSSNTEVQAQGFGVRTLGGIGITATLKSYPVSNIDTQKVIYTVDTTQEAYELPTHDPNAILDSKYKKALLVELTVVAETGASITVCSSASSDVSSLDGVVVEGQSYVNNYISNCIRIRPATLNGLQATDLPSTAPKRHIQISGETATKTAEITLLTIDVPVGESKCYFVIEYDPDLLSHISKRMFNRHEGKYRVNYLNDIDFVIYSE